MVRFPGLVVGVLGGARLPDEMVARWLAKAELILAADSGADAVLAAGFKPNIVVGDLDSLRADVSEFADVRRDASPDTTDCDKLLHLASELGHREITLLNVDGGLPDHFLAVLQSAARCGIKVNLVFQTGVGAVIVGPASRTVLARDRVSLLPISRCEGVSLSGVRWPLTDASLDPVGVTSISNQLDIRAGNEVSVFIGSGAAFLYVGDVAELQPGSGK